ncbi:hypothetical protein [Streptomyces lasiicapitis]|uniref:Uncharacterized protein n=1 Tax=Streptomyces lasiicapitis TaxID=1923961 RepID=A0ABQ2LTF2_9ACTN|nr:hypothetical protein [Streptomyces lasiicapitis]GGO42991.1 hypothetical protein GCM10012286_25800 [Streptomyces lasiicapitis]
MAALAHPLPGQARREWTDAHVAMIPLGRRFDAVRVPAERIHAAVGSDESATVAAALEDWLRGPVVQDLRSGLGPYYVLVAPDAEWQGEEVRLSTGTYLGVPRVGHIAYLMTWVVQPQRPGDLCDVGCLRALLSVAEPLKAVES